MTRACVLKDIETGLTGIAAKDGSVFTKVTCKASTLVHNAGNTWTAVCTAHYSDGSTAKGHGNLLVSQDEVTFEPDGV